mmetsp:Transcript_10154/g.26097  ORF Transcript_10154/g.26097 Transcript_10154/m.26097 type:complete len:309 (-) Transcript_10154:1151-2077(-)
MYPPALYKSDAKPPSWVHGRRCRRPASPLWDRGTPPLGYASKTYSSSRPPSFAGSVRTAPSSSRCRSAKVSAGPLVSASLFTFANPPIEPCSPLPEFTNGTRPVAHGRSSSTSLSRGGTAPAAKKRARSSAETSSSPDEQSSKRNTVLMGSETPNISGAEDSAKATHSTHSTAPEPSKSKAAASASSFATSGAAGPRRALSEVKSSGRSIRPSWFSSNAKNMQYQGTGSEASMTSRSGVSCAHNMRTHRCSRSSFAKCAIAESRAGTKTARSEREALVMADGDRYRSAMRSGGSTSSPSTIQGCLMAS